MSDRCKELLTIVVGSFSAFYEDKVPILLKKLVTAVEDIGIESEGLYRLSGNISNIKALVTQSFENPHQDFSTVGEINELTGLMKFILREMVPPLLTYKYYDQFIASVNGENDELNKNRIFKVLKTIPNSTFSNIYLLFRHLQRFDHKTK